MMFVSPRLRVVLATTHIPLMDIRNKLTIGKIFDPMDLGWEACKLLGIKNPRIAVTGLNPHAGDTGLTGTEEEEEIIPAINESKTKGVLAFGPYSADGFFGSGNYFKFDGVLAMFHDQGLIPFKALTFGSGVNFTGGLPCVRTSPDHGTAFEIAGKNLASSDSFRAAIYQAIDIFNGRYKWNWY